MPYGGIKMAAGGRELRTRSNPTSTTRPRPTTRPSLTLHTRCALPATATRSPACLTPTAAAASWATTAAWRSTASTSSSPRSRTSSTAATGTMTDDVIRLREEIAEHRALRGMKEMASSTATTSRSPRATTHEAVQWLYFGYLAAIKTQNGAAMSVGRISTFLDIYIQRDLEAGKLDETQAQELIDHLVLRSSAWSEFARIPSYNELFSGDPVWATLEMAGLGQDGRHMVTKNDFRFLHAREHGSRARAQPRCSTQRLPEAFRRTPRQGLHHHQLDPVRERRRHAPGVGRRLQHLLLRPGHPDRQGEMILWGPREPGQVPEPRHQRRQGPQVHRQAGQPHAGWPRAPPHHERVPRLR